MNDVWFRWDWLLGHLDDIAVRGWEHLLMTLIAVVVGLIIASLLSGLGLRYRRALGPVTWFAGFLYTIPSLALFALLAPFTGLTMITAEIALVSYTLLILVRNITTGLDGVSPAVKEAADAMGFSRRERFWRVEVPLALPTIIAGVRLAAVTVVGLTTVTSLLGLGGLGWFILNGLRRQFTTEIVVGSVLSVVLAVVIDLALAVLQRRLTPWAAQRAAA